MMSRFCLDELQRRSGEKNNQHVIFDAIKEAMALLRIIR
jgi:hypothetical protein